MITPENISDYLGHLVLNEDFTIHSSGGDLENDEHIACILPTFVSLCDKVKIGEPIQKISVIYKDHCYIICVSYRKICIVKRVYHMPTELKNPNNLTSTDLTSPQNSNEAIA